LSQEKIDENNRGPHDFTVKGIDRNNKQVGHLGFICIPCTYNNTRNLHQRCLTESTEIRSISLTLLRGQCLHYSEYTKCIHSTFYLILFSKLVNFLLWIYFPGVAQRYTECVKYIKGKYNLEPEYGLFWNFCLNSPRPDKNIFRIHCCPHVDAKNLALGLCVLYVYGVLWFSCPIKTLKHYLGHFNDKEKSWLVIWEAGLIIQIPAGVLVFYPSSIFYHCNVDRIGKSFLLLVEILTLYLNMFRFPDGYY
jgi:hypothetical protein